MATVNATMIMPGNVDGAVEEAMLMNHPYVRLFFLVSYILVFVFCVFGNLAILIVIATNRSMCTATNFFLANLAIADLLVGMFCVFQNAAHFVLIEHGAWPFGKVMCHSYIYILHMIPNASAGILVLLSVERFIAVIRPMLVQHLLTKGVLFMSAFLVWTFSALMNLPYLVAVQFLELQNKKTGEQYAICTRRFLMMGEINVLKVVTTMNLVIWYIIPLIILLIIYVTIGLVLMRTTEDNSVARSSQNKSFRNSPPNGSARKLPRLEAVDSRKRVIRLVVVIVLAFALLSLPRYLYLSWSVFREKNATFLLLFINSGINPVLYAFLSQRFRTALKEMRKSKLRRAPKTRSVETQDPLITYHDYGNTEYHAPLREEYQMRPLSARTYHSAVSNEVF